MFKIKIFITVLVLLQSQFAFSQSAIGQLETISGQKINRYKTNNSSGYDMNSMITGMVAQSMINSIFSSSNKNYVLVQEVKVQPTYLTTQIAGEKQNVQQALIMEKYERLMKTYKFLKDTSALKYSAFNSKKKGLLKIDSAFLSLQKQLINERLKYDNERAKKYYDRLASNVPMLSDTEPGMKLNDLKPGDVLLFEPRYTNYKDAISGSVVVVGDQVGGFLGTGTINESKISHTITYLREENGKRMYMDNMPDEGPVIIDEAEMKHRYVGREASVAQIQKGYVAEPLNEDETKRLWNKAQEMSNQNKEFRKEKDASMLNFETSMYGAWGKDNVVCSEASWALLKATGRDLPLSKSMYTQVAGVDFSPSDFYNYKQSFLISKINLSK
jgi:hypothetical protein